jgi:hypothetical protein
MCVEHGGDTTMLEKLGLPASVARDVVDAHRLEIESEWDFGIGRDAKP